MDKKFEGVDQKFTMMDQKMDQKFTSLRQEMNQKFEVGNKKFERLTLTTKELKKEIENQSVNIDFKIENALHLFKQEIEQNKIKTSRFLLGLTIPSVLSLITLILQFLK